MHVVVPVVTESELGVSDPFLQLLLLVKMRGCLFSGYRLHGWKARGGVIGCGTRVVTNY